MTTAYLKEGLLYVESPERGTLLHDLSTGRDSDLDEAQAEAARRLLFGVNDPALARTLGADRVEQRDEPFDRKLRDRLAALDAGFAWVVPRSAAPLVRLCELAHSLTRHVRLDLDQLPVLPETAARRALLLRERCGAGAEIALVGDDDLVSVALAALGLRPTVFDIDAELGSILAVVRERLGFDIEFRLTDLREPLPDDAKGSFDGFCTDPETSRECVGLFASRGVALTRPGGIGLIACAEEFVTLIDDVVAGCGVTPLGRLRRAGNYRDPTARLAPYRSDLHIVEVTAESRPVVGAAQCFAGNLFPFGLDGGDHLVATVPGCQPNALAGAPLADLVRVLAGDTEGDAEVVEAHPMPIRVVTVQRGEARAQATVRSDGATVDLDVAPAPATEGEALAMTRLICDALGAADGTFRTLRRLG